MSACSIQVTLFKLLNYTGFHPKRGGNLYI